MNEIPEDIKKIAEGLFAPYNYQYDGPSEDDVAQIILAERMRCAKVALNVAKEFADVGLDAHSIGASRVGENILDAALSTPLASVYHRIW